MSANTCSKRLFRLKSKVDLGRIIKGDNGEISMSRCEESICIFITMQCILVPFEKTLRSNDKSLNGHKIFRMTKSRRRKWLWPLTEVMVVIGHLGLPEAAWLLARPCWVFPGHHGTEFGRRPFFWDFLRLFGTKQHFIWKFAQFIKRGIVRFFGR